MEEERNVPLNPKKGTRNKEQVCLCKIKADFFHLKMSERMDKWWCSTGNSFACRGLVRPRLSFDEQPLGKAPRCLQWDEVWR